MLSIDQAVKTRWNAQSLGNTITGGVYQIQVPERTAMPYCVYSTISDLKNTQTHNSRYSRVDVQFQVYDTTPELVSSEAVLIQNAFQHANRAATNPLTIADSSRDYILDCALVQNYVVTQLSDQVFAATLTLSMLYGQEGQLSPS